MSDYCCEPDQPLSSRVPTDEEADEQLSRLARGLSHPTRVRILRVLADKERCYCGEIVGLVGFAQSTVSQHLKILKESGLVRGEVEGPATCYCLSRSGLELVERLVSGVWRR